MVHYKLSYFDLRSRAEVARQLFALAEVDYEDYRIPRPEWPKLKPAAPFGHIPYLEVDGQRLGQSVAINRYLARRFGFAGKSDWESAQIDALADQLTDYTTELAPLYWVLVGKLAGDKEKLQKDVGDPAFAKFFPIVADYLKKNTSGYLIGDRISWVDIGVAEHMANIEKLLPNVLEKYPEILAHKQKIHSIPTIKKWLEKRPQTAW